MCSSNQLNKNKAGHFVFLHMSVSDKHLHAMLVKQCCKTVQFKVCRHCKLNETFNGYHIKAMVKQPMAVTHFNTYFKKIIHTKLK